MLNEELKNIVGNQNVLDAAETLELYAKDESFVQPIRPRCVVRLDKAEHIPEVIKWANRTKTPLVPVSSGPPHFRGDTVPSAGGAVVVDLGKLNQIIRIDRKNRVAMLQPGVTFSQLVPALRTEGLVPFMPLVPRASKSVITSELEREPITTPRYHWESQDPLRCVEVFYGTGEMMRTGSAAVGELEEQWAVGKAQVKPMGPAHLDFAKLVQGAQGSMGIVTWGSIGCRPLPEIKKTFLIGSQKVEHLIDFTYKLLWKKLGEECFIVNDVEFARLFCNDKHGADAIKNASPTWFLVFSIEGYGMLPEQRVEYQEKELMGLAQSCGLEPANLIAGITSERVAETLSGPSDEPYWKLRDRGGCHDIFFLTTLDKTPEFITEMGLVLRAYDFSSGSMGVYVQPTVLGCNCHCEFNLAYDPTSPSEINVMKRLEEDAVLALSKKGAFFSRPYGSWVDVAYQNAADTISAQRKLKAIFDPNTILNPGKLCF